MSDEMLIESTEEFDPKALGEKLAEKVDAEEARVEAELAAEQAEEESLPDIPEDQRQILEALGEYLAKVQSALGETQEIRPCHFCHGMGFNPISILPDAHSHPCDDCAGIGRVATGSLVLGNETAMCASCNGAGFIRNVPAATVPSTVEETAAPYVLSTEEIERIAADARARVGVNAA